MLSAAIPVLASIIDTSWVAPLLGGAIAVLTGLRQIFRWRDNWLLFTQAQVRIEKAVNLYAASARPYNVDEASELLVAHVEDIVLEQVADWYNIRSEQHDGQ
jgi:hypothetical protein